MSNWLFIIFFQLRSVDERCFYIKSTPFLTVFSIFIFRIFVIFKGCLSITNLIELSLEHLHYQIPLRNLLLLLNLAGYSNYFSAFLLLAEST